MAARRKAAGKRRARARGTSPDGIDIHDAALSGARTFLTSYGLAMQPVAGWKPYRFHEQVAEALEWLERTPDARLILNAPPRLGKTVLTSWLLTTWYLGRHPAHDVIATTYAQQRAEDIGRRVRQMMGGERFKSIFPGANVLERYRAATRIDLEAGGSYRGVSIDGTATGRGAHLLVVDDPIKGPEQARSALWQATLQEAWRYIFRPRVNSGGKIVVNMARWATSDFDAWLMEQEGNWRVLSFPMVDENDEPLCPELFDRAACEAIKVDVGSRAWSALYMQKPSEEVGKIFDRAWWNYFGQDNVPECDEIVLSWDCKLKDTVTTGSYVCGEAWGRSSGAARREDGHAEQRLRYNLLDVARGRWNFHETLKRMDAMAKRWPTASAILVEEAALGPAAIEVLRRKYSNVVAVVAKGSKIARAEAIAPMVESGSAHLCRMPWLDEFVEACANFPAKPNDQVDAMTQALQRLSREETNDDDGLASPLIDGLTQSAWQKSL